MPGSMEMPNDSEINCAILLYPLLAGTLIMCALMCVSDAFETVESSLIVGI